MWIEMLTALSLVMIIEGVMPFLAPQQWRLSLLKLAAQRNNTIRWFGLIIMVLGTMLLTVVRS
ncbi:hypothetical protein SIN8267_01769 [Sinobacterium norvegicum]|uniref:DUF2065 domain-containing protein n=1 Tax=Sinobacterium norvegicum TaxID=1641715 RepID=A0ABM9AEW4_9GAMM|nr:hypothetical protein SIN8267_01769 [Sinobacterium norvegicum]